MKAIYKGLTIAESNDTIVVEGNHYFPPKGLFPGEQYPYDMSMERGSQIL